MNDIYDAIERYSADLSLRVARLAASRGWANKPYSWMLKASDSKFIMVVASTVSFPGGYYASFTPQNEPSGDSWSIDVRRTDAVAREWADGLRVTKAEKGFVLLHQSGVLSDEALATLLDELATP